ncbi:MAG: flagellar biosynthesis protein FlhB [Planctomycetota bacterium]
MADSGGDKKHSATEFKRRQAREKGQVAKSQDLTSAALLVTGVLLMKWLGGSAAGQMAAALAEALSQNHLGEFQTSDASQSLLRSSTRMAIAASPILLAMFIAAIVINVGQIGFLIVPDKLVPKLSNINPLSGAKRILSIQGLVKLGFGLFKVAIIGAVAYAAILSYQDDLLGMAAMSIANIAETMFNALMGISLWIVGALFILALLEYAFQRWKYEQDLMMTDQELRDELKNTEGDPQVAARRRQVHRQMAMNRAANEVPGADVVVSNPTELAIAIKYDPQTMPAPLVVAKGAGMIAQKIRRIALEHGVPVVERKPLAQVLYKTVDVGDVIPADQYQAVAEVLRYVYQLQGKEIPTAA